MRDIYREAIEEGEKRGVKKGERNKSIEIAKNLLNDQIPVDAVASYTGLSREEVLRLISGTN